MAIGSGSGVVGARIAAESVGVFGVEAGLDVGAGEVHRHPRDRRLMVGGRVARRQREGSVRCLVAARLAMQALGDSSSVHNATEQVVTKAGSLIADRRSPILETRPTGSCLTPCRPFGCAAADDRYDGRFHISPIAAVMPPSWHSVDWLGNYEVSATEMSRNQGKSSHGIEIP
jgi:hypothetical protein